MQTAERKRLLCWIAIAVLLITGMYSGAAGIDSSFACVLEEETHAAITSLSGSFDTQEMCTSEMLGLYQFPNVYLLSE